MLKPTNIIAALHARQFGYRNEVIDPILKRTAEDVISKKSYLIDFASYKFNLNRDVRTTFLTVFSPDGKRVACAHGDGTISIISMKTKKVERVLTGGHVRSLWTLSWATFSTSPDYIIASGCLGGHVNLWFNDDRSTISYNFNKPIASLSFHPIIPMLAVAVDNTLVFWDIRDGDTPQIILPFEENETKIRYVSYDNVGKYLVTGIKKWDPDSIEHLLESRTYTIEVWTLANEGHMTNLDPKNSRIVVEKSSLHNDSTVAIDKGFTKLATTVTIYDGEHVNIYSLKPNDFGTLLQCISSISGVIVSLSFSPSLTYLIIGYNTSKDTSTMSIINVKSRTLDDTFMIPEIILHRLATRQISKIKSLTGAINECIQDYIIAQANLICVCSNKRCDIIHEKSRCRLTCDWFLNYVRSIDECLSCFNNLSIHDVKFKLLIKQLKEKYKVCYELTEDVLAELINFCREVQEFLRHNTRLCEDQPIVKLNCLSWSPDIDNGILASFNNGNVIMIK